MKAFAVILSVFLFSGHLWAQNSCQALFGPTIRSFSEVKTELKQQLRLAKTFPEKNQVIERILNDYAAEATPDAFTSMALYLINWKTTYVGGRGSVSSEYVVEAFEIIRRASLSVDLNATQAGLIQDAMINRPNSIKELLSAGLHFGWSNGDPVRVLAIAQTLPFGKSKNVAGPSRFKANLNGFKSALDFYLERIDSKPDRNKMMASLLTEYSKKVSSEEFTKIVLYLVNWKVVYFNPYFGLDGTHTLEGFEHIRQVTLQVPLNQNQIVQIKSAMENRPGSLSELLATKGISLGGWNLDKTALTQLLEKPFGSQTSNP